MNREKREKHKYKSKALWILLLYISMMVVGYSEYSNSQTTDQRNNNHNIDPSEKIEQELLTKIQNSNNLDEKVNLFIMHDGINIDVHLPNSVSIIRRYSLINALLAESSLRVIQYIAQLENVISIWEDKKHQSNLENHLDLSPFLRSASSNKDPNYVDFNNEINANPLKEQGYNGSDIIIAVLDTGVDITGAAGGDLDDFDENTSSVDPKYLGGVSMVPHEPLYYTDLNGRGTFHTGIACGTGHLNESHQGVAPGAYYLNVKVYDSVGITYWSFIISGIEWAISNGADIILFATTIPGLYIDPVSEAVNTAVDRGVLVVAPAGDDGPGYMSINTPGAAHKAFTVGAYDSFTQDVAEFSSRGPSFDFGIKPHIIAPGVDLIGTRARIFSDQNLDMLSSAGTIVEELSQYGFNFNLDLDIDTSLLTANMIPTSQYGEEVIGAPNYTRSSGTGAAAAVVAGAAAILMSAFPLATPILIQQALMETATSIRADGDMNAEGAGLIDVYAAFQYLEELFEPNLYKIVPSSLPLLYSGVVTSSDFMNISQYSNLIDNNLLEYDITATFSTQAMISALAVTNSSDTAALNMSSIHLPLNQFGINYTLSDSPNKSHFRWFSEFNVVREMSQMISAQFYQEGYNRYSGVLELDGLYTAVIAETWSYAGEYNDTTFNLDISNPYYDVTLPTEYQMMNITDRVNAIKLSFQFINEREDLQSIKDMSLISYFKADLFLNETGVLSENFEEQINSALDFSYDDILRFNSSNQVIYMQDENNNTDFNVNQDKFASLGFKSLSHPIEKYSFGDGIELLTNITFNSNNPNLWNSSTDEFLLLEGNGEIDPAFASTYHIGDVNIHEKAEFNSVLSVGQADSFLNSETVMFRQIELIDSNVTKYNITDLMVLSANFSRMGEINQEYICEAKIINIGNVEVSQSQLAFAINRSNDDDTWEIFSIIFMVHNLKPFEIRKYVAEWVPLKTGVYSVAWIIGDLTDLYSIQDEANLLNNMLSRTIFIINGTYYEQIKIERFMVFPYKLDQNPMRLYSPLDFGIYNLTCISVREIKNVEIKADGIGKNMLIFIEDLLKESDLISNPQNAGEIPQASQLVDVGIGDDDGDDMFGDFAEFSALGNLNLPNSIITDINPYQNVPLVVFVSPFTPPGKNYFNITFTEVGKDEPFHRIPVELEIYPNRGRIWFDAVHVNLFVSDNLVGTGGLSGITDLDSLNISTDIGDSFGGFGDLGSIDFSSTGSFDLSAFIDLESRLDTTWGNFFNLRELWARPESNNGKGASLYTIIPFLEFNITELTGGLDITQIRTSELLPPTSFLGNTLGDYSFRNEVFTTNTINHDNLQFFDALVLNDPEQSLLESEIEDIVEWVDRGGTLYVWSNDMYHTNVQSLNDLLVNFDMKLNNETFYPYKDFGYYNVPIEQTDYDGHLFSRDISISNLYFKDPIEVESLSPNSDVEILCKSGTGKGVIGITNYGRGRVMVVGDNEAFKETLLKFEDNEKFAQIVLQWGLQNYYESNVTSSPAIVPKYEYGFVDFDITNYDFILENNLTSKGFLFLSAFFFEDGTLINASIYGMETPVLPMFYTNESRYSQFFSANWYEAVGDYYVMIIIDHPAAVSELFYLKFEVVNAPPPPIIEKYVGNTPTYSHFIDIAGIIANVHMFLLIWYYNFKKYEGRLQITPLQGEKLNMAKAKLSEGEALIRLLLIGMNKGEIEEIEKIRFLLSNRKRFNKYFKNLKDFGEYIGEHY